jgi:hypothetical protein
MFIADALKLTVKQSVCGALAEMGATSRQIDRN